MKQFLLISLLGIFSLGLNGQSAFPTVEETIEMQKAKPFFIQITESASNREYFPKLYPIGFIIKERDRVKRKTKYLLGDFASKEEADKALLLVKKSGYDEAFVVNFSK